MAIAMSHIAIVGALVSYGADAGRTCDGSARRVACTVGAAAIVRVAFGSDGIAVTERRIASAVVAEPANGANADE